MSSACFLFRVAEPEYDLSRNIHIGREVAWFVPTRPRDLCRDAVVYLWMDSSLERTGLYGRARVTSDGVYIDRTGTCRVGLRFEARFSVTATPVALRRLISRNRRPVVKLSPELSLQLERSSLGGPR